MKFLFLLFAVVTSVSGFAIDDASFKNKDRYALLNFPEIKKDKTFTVTANCIPPEGKKLNSNSVIRLWEKTGNTWEITDKIFPDEHLSFVTTYKMSKKLVSQKIDSEIALEIDFIYCNKYGGGQCAMEKYLGKIKRSEKSKSDQLQFDLKI